MAIYITRELWREKKYTLFGKGSMITVADVVAVAAIATAVSNFLAAFHGVFEA
jgi:hypothetical protein